MSSSPERRRFPGRRGRCCTPRGDPGDLIGGAVADRVRFFIAGTAPLVSGVIAILAARMPWDEIAHPLEDGPIHLDTGGVPAIVN